jgi:alkylation response protein AidB-like acyl-CoA dehydrogenase
MDGMTYAQQSEHLAGPIALLKAHVTASANEVASHAVQIWGGRGITKAGMGGLIEMYQRTTKYDSILGGSEESESPFLASGVSRGLMR